MSEIKGQLLGIVLVISVFGVVAGLLTYAFKSSANSIANKIIEEPTITEKAPTTDSAVYSYISDDNLLTF